MQGLEVLGGFRDLPELVTVPRAGQETSRPPFPYCPWAFISRTAESLGCPSSAGDAERIHGPAELLLCRGWNTLELLRALNQGLKKWGWWGGLNGCGKERCAGGMWGQRWSQLSTAGWAVRGEGRTGGEQGWTRLHEHSKCMKAALGRSAASSGGLGGAS